MWSFSSYLGRAQPPPSFRFRGVSGHRGENCSAGGPSSSCLRGCFHARSLSPLSSSELVLAVLCDVPVLSLLVSRTPQVCGCSPLLAPRGACPGLPAGALQPVRPSSPGWLSSLRSPGSAVLRLVGCWSQKDPPPHRSLVSSAGISPGKKGPNTLTCPQLSLLSSGAVRLRTPPGAGEAAPAGSLDSHKSDVPSCFLFPSDHHSRALGPALNWTQTRPQRGTRSYFSSRPQKLLSSKSIQ